MRRIADRSAVGVLLLLAACSEKAEVTQISAGGAPPAGGTSSGGGSANSGGSSPGGQSSGGATLLPVGGMSSCRTRTCRELGWACGYMLDECGSEKVTNCADEGLSCGTNEVCLGGVDAPTRCVTGGGQDCALCDKIPKCSKENGGEATHLTGRVVTPGRDDANKANQVGVPNALVYITRSADAAELPAVPTGIPSGKTSCDRCEDQELGPVLAGTVTDATGRFQLDEFIPVGTEFLLVVKAGRFRRAVKYTLPEDAACKTTELPSQLPENPTRLPRSMTDGLAVNIPRIAVSTGQIDAMECVFEKMGLAHGEFGNPTSDGSGARIQLYRGGPMTRPSGARIDAATPHASELYGSLQQLESYDLLVSDCEGQSWDGTFDERRADGAKLREFVNRGGRLFASHLSFSWLHENGTQTYSPDSAIGTGLGPAAEWATMTDMSTTGTGVISVGRPHASPRIANFTDWMVNEGITTEPDHEFDIIEPRSQATALGDSSEEFVFQADGKERVQQFSFNTPYGAPAEAACGRVAYSGFHVSVGGGTSPFGDATFPEHCMGDLTKQEKVLLYMLFDLGACIGVEPPPTCTPATCQSLGASCGFAPDGCGNVLDCGACSGPPK
ncbi:MAG TPA: hypothetical protein VFQ61_11490 [Polyangiaceae bacterium]|nr:hypothetical protein [Polyangiaceae bacterium]